MVSKSCISGYTRGVIRPNIGYRWRDRRFITTERVSTRGDSNNINAAAELVRLRVKNAASARIAHEQATKMFEEGASDKASVVDSAAAASRRARQDVKIALDNLALEMKNAAAARQTVPVESVQVATEKAVVKPSMGKRVVGFAVALPRNTVKFLWNLPTHLRNLPGVVMKELRHYWHGKASFLKRAADML